MSRRVLSCLTILATLQACAPQQPAQRLAHRSLPPDTVVYTPPAQRLAYTPPPPMRAAYVPPPVPSYQPSPERTGFTPGQALLATAVFLGGVCWLTDCLSPGVEEPGQRRGGGGGGADAAARRAGDAASSSGDGGTLFDFILPEGGNAGLYGNNPGAGVFRPRERWD